MIIETTYRPQISMSNEVIAIISGCLGAVLAGLFGWIKAITKTGSDDRINFRSDILRRIQVVEEKSAKLEREIVVWKGRYWSLYTWLVNFCMVNGLDATPPSFHEMRMDDLEQKFKERAKKKQKNENT